jgi:hypothetical protein
MYIGDRNSQFWRRHPWLKLVFALLLATLAGWMALAIWQQGSFNFGRGPNAQRITRADDPLMFFLFIAFLVSMAMILPVIAALEFRKRRKS